MSKEMVKIEEIEPFARLRNEVAKMYDAYLDQIQPHFDWLDEILEQAKQAILTRPDDVELLPKTPSEKKRGRGRPKRIGSLKNRNSSNGQIHPSRGRLTAEKMDLAIGQLAIGSETPGADESDYTSSLVGSTPDEAQGVDDLPPILPPVIVEEEEEDVVAILPPVIIEEEEDDINFAVEEANVGEEKEIDAEDQNGHAMDHEEEKQPTLAKLQVPEANDNTNYATPERVTGNAPDPTTVVVVKSKSVLTGTPESRNFKLDSSIVKLVQPKSMLPVLCSAGKAKIATPSSSLTPRSTPLSYSSRHLTPKKSGVKESNVEARERLQQQLVEATSKREEILKQKIEEQKRKREERFLVVAKTRLIQKEKEEQVKRKIEEKYQTPSSIDVEEKRKLRPRYPDSATRQQENERRKAQENEKHKEQDRIHREQAELRRLAVDRERQLQKLPPVVLHSGVKQGNQYLPKPAAAHQAGSSTISKKPIPPPLNATYLASTSSANKSGVSESYDITPLRQMKPSTATNYDISDIRSSDETDDEDNPRKKIPSWAQGAQLKMALTTQYYTPPNLDDLFGVVEMPDLTKLFNVHRKRFFKRTSSAKWDSPIHPHSSK